MKVRSRQSNRYAKGKIALTPPRVAARERGFAGNHLMRNQSVRESFGQPHDETPQQPLRADAKEVSLQGRSSSAVELPSVPPIVHEVLRSPGQPLDPDTRAFMEPRFGHDFSQVRLHTNASAAKSINARAFTASHNIVFGPGEYAPQTESGRRLLSHELTHVVQQQAGIHLKDGVGEASAAYEQHADMVARSVSEGYSAVNLLAAYASYGEARGTVGHDVIQYSSLAPVTPLVPEVIAEKPESDFTYQGQNGVSYYVKLRGGATTVGIAVISGEETEDKVTRKHMENVAKDNLFPKSWVTKPWMYHKMYGGGTQIQLDRWGDISDFKGKTPLKCLNVTEYTALAESAEDVLSLYQSSAPNKKIPGVTYSASGAGLDPSTGKLCEFVVLLLKDTDKLTHTYMYRNEKFSPKEGQSKTAAGKVAYYSLDYPPGFHAAWEEKASTEIFQSKMDTLLQGKQFTVEKGLKPASYEAYKSASDMRDIKEGGQTKTVPISESWGKPLAADPQQIYSKLQPLFPPEKMVANFASNKSDIGSMVDVVEAGVEFSKEKFLAGLKDVVMYLTYYADVKTTIEGHTSRKGGDQTNTPLSTKRADSVKDYIIAHAVEWSGKPLKEDRIKTTGKGSADAAQAGKGKDNDDVADRKIVLLYKVTP